jgi:uncharacterized phiE125 gp8 family phage protein
MRLTLVTEPAQEPVGLGEAKDHLNIADDDHDGEVADAISAARARVETLTGRQLIEAVYELRFDQTPGERVICLPRPPLIEVEAITYLDAAGDEQTWDASNYQVDAPAGPKATRGRIAPAPGVAWPTVKTDAFNAFVVRFKAGYGDEPESVPHELRREVKHLIARYYENRGDVLASDASARLGAFRVY